MAGPLPRDVPTNYEKATGHTAKKSSFVASFVPSERKQSECRMLLPEHLCCGRMRSYCTGRGPTTGIRPCRADIRMQWPHPFSSGDQVVGGRGALTDRRLLINEFAIEPDSPCSDFPVLSSLELSFSSFCCPWRPANPHGQGSRRRTQRPCSSGLIHSKCAQIVCSGPRRSEIRCSTAPCGCKRRSSTGAPPSRHMRSPS